MARAVKFKLTAPIVREPVLHKQIADSFRIEICHPGRVSIHGVTWWSVDMAAYAGTVPGIRTGRGCIAGVPDIIIVYRGKAHFIEVKALDGGLSPAQQIVGSAILMAAAQFGIARNASEAIAYLDQWDIPRAHRIRGL